MSRNARLGVVAAVLALAVVAGLVRSRPGAAPGPGTAPSVPPHPERVVPDVAAQQQRASQVSQVLYASPVPARCAAAMEARLPGHRAERARVFVAVGPDGRVVTVVVHEVADPLVADCLREGLGQSSFPPGPPITVGAEFLVGAPDGGVPTRGPRTP